MAFKKIRNMKVYEQSGYHYKSTPTIMLKGQWLKELGFEYGTPICVECSGGKLIKRGPGNRGPSECGTTHEATSGMSS